MRPRDLARSEGREPCAWWVTTNRGPAWAYVDRASGEYVQVEARGSARYWLPVMSTHYAYPGTACEAVASLVEDLQRAGVVVLDVEAPVPLDDVPVWLPMVAGAGAGADVPAICGAPEVVALLAFMRRSTDKHRDSAARGGWRE